MDPSRRARQSRLQYLTLYAAAALDRLDAGAIAGDLGATLAALCRADDPRTARIPTRVRITREQVALERPAVLPYVIDLLIVDLEARFRVDVETWAGGKRALSKGLEKLIPAALQPHWSYQHAILLSVVRNAVVHGAGAVDLADDQGRRLPRAGWSAAELAALPVLTRRSADDLFAFKRATRTLLGRLRSCSSSS